MPERNLSCRSVPPSIALGWSEVGMSYDHTKKIGNQGDVAKHAVLAAVVEKLLRDAPEEPFVYAESHTGYAEYTLPQEGEWREGIGELSEEAAKHGWPPPLDAYRDTCFASKLHPNDRYPGSSGLVFRLVKRQRAIEFTLYEVNPAACCDLALHYPFFESVRVRREDGIKGIGSIEGASLVLIDPPDLDRRGELVALLEHLNQKQIPFLCWTPRSSGCFKDGWYEGGPSAAFFDEAAAYSCYRVRWRADWKGQGMKGCQITVNRALGKVAQDVLDALCRIMPGWTLE